MNKRQDKRLRTATMLVAAMLVVSLFSLAQKLPLSDARSVELNERYPNLYANASGAFVAPEEKTVYFTFDDGPSKNTPRILDILKEQGIKATFFVSSQEEDKAFAAMLLCRMRDEGHTIALHTACHNYGTLYMSMDAYLADLNGINDFIVESTGIYPVLMRFPGGSGTGNCSPALMKQIADEVTRRGYIFHDWTVVSGDDGSRPQAAGDLYKQVMKGVKGRQMEIILFHDNPTPTTTPDALLLCIDGLKEQGYVFDRLTEESPPTQFIRASK